MGIGRGRPWCLGESCIVYMRHGRLAVVRRTRVWCTCVCQMKVKKDGTESEGRQSNHHLSQARSSTGTDTVQRFPHSFDGRARAGAAE